MRFLKLFLRWFIALWCVLALYNVVFPPISTLMMARVLTFRSVMRDYVPLTQISSPMIRAVIAAEDGAFCSHHGVDWQAMQHAVVTPVAEGEAPSRGGSTLTMQTVKNLYLWMGYSYLRKPIEIPLAILFDAGMHKRRILEIYLNVAEFGDGVFGAEAAARHYFHKSAKTLSLREASLLVAVLPNPTRRNARRPSAFVRNYAASIAARATHVDTQCLQP